jgi:hypothetical protein
MLKSSGRRVDLTDRDGPVQHDQWTDPAIDASFERVCEPVVRGLGVNA